MIRIKTIYLVLIASLFGLICMLPTIAEESDVIWTAEGMQLYDQEKYEEALIALDKAIEENPNDAEAFKYKGYSLGMLKRYEEALENFDSALELDPDNTWIMNSIGITYLRLRKYEEALDICKKAIEINPTPKLHICIGNSYYYLKKYSKAIKQFDSALDINPKHEDALFYKSGTLIRMESYEEAIIILDDVIEDNYSNYRALFNKGQALRGLERYDEAMVYFNKCLELEGKEDPSLWTSIGNIYSDQKEYEKSITYYDKAIELDPNYATPYLNKGNFLLWLNRTEEAEEACKMANNLDSDIHCYQRHGIIMYSLIILWVIMVTDSIIWIMYLRKNPKIKKKYDKYKDIRKWFPLFLLIKKDDTRYEKIIKIVYIISSVSLFGLLFYKWIL